MVESMMLETHMQRIPCGQMPGSAATHEEKIPRDGGRPVKSLFPSLAASGKLMQRIKI